MPLLHALLVSPMSVRWHSLDSIGCASENFRGESANPPVLVCNFPRRLAEARGRRAEGGSEKGIGQGRPQPGAELMSCLRISTVTYTMYSIDT